MLFICAWLLDETFTFHIIMTRQCGKSQLLFGKWRKRKASITRQRELRGMSQSHIIMSQLPVSDFSLLFRAKLTAASWSPLKTMMFFFRYWKLVSYDTLSGVLYTWNSCIGARVSKVPKLFGRISGDIILFVFSKRRRLEARNFSVYFNFYCL